MPPALFVSWLHEYEATQRDDVPTDLPAPSAPRPRHAPGSPVVPSHP